MRRFRSGSRVIYIKDRDSWHKWLSFGVMKIKKIDSRTVKQVLAFWES